MTDCIVTWQNFKSVVGFFSSFFPSHFVTAVALADVLVLVLAKTKYDKLIQQNQMHNVFFLYTERKVINSNIFCAQYLNCF